MRTISLTLILLTITILITGCISPELRTARIAINEKDWNRAIEALDQELTRMPKNSEAYYLKGLCYAELNEWAKMSESFSKSLEFSEQFSQQIENERSPLVSRYVKRAVAADEEERVEDALAYIDTALIMKKDWLICQQGAVIAYNAKNYEAAVKYANLGMEYEGEEQDLTMRKVMLAVAREKEDYPQIIEWARILMKLIDPATGSVDSAGEGDNLYLSSFDDLVIAYENLGEHDAAQKAIEEAVRLYPENMSLKMNLALIMIKRGDYETGKSIYLDVLKDDPMDFDANLTIGTIYSNKKLWEESIPYLERAYELDPNNLAAVQNLLAAYYNTEKFEKAAELKKVFDAMSGDKE